jgi:hypothetical protein
MAHICSAFRVIVQEGFVILFCLNNKNLVFFFSAPKYCLNSQVGRFQSGQLTINGGFYYVLKHAVVGFFQPTKVTKH